MPDGEGSPMVESSTSDSVSVGGDDDHLKLVSEEVKRDKDPRRVARKYQLELCERALQENVIVWLGTGCGKTHIAVLLMYEMGHLIRKPKKNICVFLAPTVALVQQQAKVIEDSLDFKVQCYCGSSKSLKSREDWDKELIEYEVFVMTPKTLFHSLSHCYIKMDSIELLIFDECHHAQVNSNHPYAEIMKVFYKPNGGKLPRIFGMTASPVVGKGASNPANLPKTINSLEHILDAKVYSVESKEELDRFVASPVLVMYDYGTNAHGTCSSYITCCSKLVDIKRQCIAILGRKEGHIQHQRNTKKLLSRMHDNLMFCLENLGIWGALQACHVLGDHSERDELVEVEKSGRDDSLCDNYLAQVAALLSSACGEGGNETDPFVDFLREPFFSRKLLRLTGILSSFRSEPTTKCIIFVNRIVTARCLSCILQKLKILASWKSGFLVGIHSGLKSMSRKTTKAILDKFHSGELNLLVATKVGEEGLDIQTCSLVIRFDLPETVASFIQSRGRARMPQSQYALLVNSGNTKDLNLIKSFKRNEEQINFEVAFRTSDEVFISSQERVYKVDSSGATISSSYSISLLHQYCVKLPHDEYFDPKPMFFYFDDWEGTVCRITFPGNAPIHQIVSDPQSSMEAAKRDACLKAIEELHKIGALNDFLLPGKGETNKQEVLVGSDIDSYEEASHQGELHEMLVPSALQHAWTEKDSPLFLQSYFIEFKPEPKDRDYKKFGFFIKARLPFEAETMELDLHLARGRSVITKFILFGLAEFDDDQIRMAHHFQEMFLKLILDRSEFIPEYVTLGKNHSCQSRLSTFYLLLPVLLQEHEKQMMVDWETVRRCLSSPVFRHPADVHEIPIFNGYIQLANGQRRMRDVENSLIYAPHKKAFYLIANVVHEKNGLSPLKDSAAFTHADHFRERFSTDLKYPDQPFLRAKPLFSMHNLLHNRKSEDRAESQELEEYFIDLPPELCELKIIGFSKDIASSLSLLPSIMHRLENLLVAIELKQRLSSSFPEGDQVSAYRILEALTTEKCQERLSLERLETLGDAFLKYAVTRHLFLKHDRLDEGGLTGKRSEVVNNSNLCKLAISHNLQAYIRDQAFEPSEFFPLGRPCLRYCSKETQATTHSQISNSDANHRKSTEARCTKNHHLLHKKTIADVVEALVGAFLVDSGFKAVTAFLRWIGVQVEFEASELVNVCRASNSYIPLSSLVDVPLLEDNLGYWFLHQGLLLQALVHPSYSNHGGGCYQRLEFLGDAVLDYLITSYLYSAYPKLKPGQMTDLRSMFVNNKVFAHVAVDRSFHKFLICNSSDLSDSVKEYVDFFKSPEFRDGCSEGPKCPKALGDIVESCIGAILLDSGFNLKSIWNIMLSFLDPIINFPWLQLSLVSPVRELQELCQFCNLDLEFQTSEKEGLFLVEAKASNNDVCVTASTTNISKKDAVIITSRIVCTKLKAEGCVLKSKSLKEVIKSSLKMEAKLIGYDETPINVILHAVTGNKKNVQSSFYSDSSSVPVSRQASTSTFTPKHANSSGTSGGSCTGTARSLLYQICAANCWKAPSFECCREEGPGHLKLFSYKVIVKIEDAPDLIIESFGAVQSKKRDAAENAAEGALWYLKQGGYLVNKE